MRCFARELGVTCSCRLSHTSCSRQHQWNTPIFNSKTLRNSSGATGFGCIYTAPFKSHYFRVFNFRSRGPRHYWLRVTQSEHTICWGRPTSGWVCVQSFSRPSWGLSCLSTAADCSAQAVPVVCAQVFEELDGKCCEEAVAVDLRRADCCSPASQVCQFFISVWSNIFHSWGDPSHVISVQWNGVE